MNVSFETKDNKDEWLTPPRIFQPLQPFDLDPCEPIDPPWRIARGGYDMRHNGLVMPWKGFVWCNPPYGKETPKWLAKMADHNNGIALIFARTDTRMFHDYIFNADAILFIKGRLSFYSVDGIKGGTAGAPSCLVAWGQTAVTRLQTCGIHGKLVMLC